MRRLNWLTKFAQSLTCWKVGQNSKPRRRTRATGSVITERLESRRLLTASPAKVGSEILVNAGNTIGEQYQPVVAMDSSGDYVIAWESNPLPGVYGIYAQRYNSTGTAQGSPITVNNAAYSQASPAIAIDSAGNFVVTWDNNSAVYAQRYNASGVALGDNIQVSASTNVSQSSSSVAMDAAGDFVVCWNYFGNGSVAAQRYNSSGVPQGGNFTVGFTDSQTGNNVRSHTPSVAMNASGQFVVAYSANTFHHFVYATRYDSSGNLQGTVQVTSSTLNTDVFEARDVAMIADGSFVVTWQYSSLNVNDARGIYAQRFDGTGTAQGSTILVESSGSFQGYNSLGIIEAPVAMDAAGDFAISWTYASGSSGTDINEQFYNAAGVAQGGPVNVNTFTTGDQHSSSLAMDAAGDFVVVWQSQGQDGSAGGIYAQLFLTTTTPLLLQIETTTLSAAGPLSTPVTISLNTYDAINDNWVGATLAITGNYQNGQDVLSFTNTATITGTWNAATGTLTLTGTDTVSNYRAALRNVLYHNTSSIPNTALTRTITFQSNAGATSSNTVTRNLTVRATTSPPTITGLSPSGFFVQGTPSLQFASTVVVAEPDGLNIQSATVSFANWQPGDRLSFYNSYALQHTFTEDLMANTATLTITGSETAAHYQTTLQSLLFWNVAGQPNSTITRVATIMVSDQFNSASSTENLNVYQYLAGLSTTVNYVQGSAPVTLAPNLIVTPPAGVTTISSATVSFTNWQGEDRLAFYNSEALQHSFTENLVAHTAVLTISGNATPAGYQTLLRSVTYQDVAGQPITSIKRIAKFAVNDSAYTGSATQNVTVIATNQPPLVQVNSSTALTYKVDSAPIAIMGMALVSDPDSDNLKSLTVQITSGYQGGHDVLTFVNQLGISGSFNSSTGMLTLSGLSYAGNYRQALRSVTYNTTGIGVLTATRVFTVIATDDTSISSIPVTNSVTVTP